MKKGFTLVEFTVSIVLFFIISIFLYKTLDNTKKSNAFFDSKVALIINQNQLKKILIEDIFESTKKITITQDKNKNSIVQLYTHNTFHNAFYTHITYLVTKENNLVRIESLKEFNPKKLNEGFFKFSYIDRIVSKIDVFEVSKLKDNKKALSVVLKKENETVMLFGSLQI